MIKKIQKTIFISIAMFFYLDIKNVSAQGGAIGIEIESPLAKLDIHSLIASILSFVVKVGTVVAVFMVIYSGFLFVTAQGDETKITKAKKTLFFTIIGALILIGAQVLSEVICNTANQLGAGAKC